MAKRVSPPKPATAPATAEAVIEAASAFSVDAGDTGAPTERARGAGDQPVASPGASEQAQDGPAETGAVEIDAAAGPASVDPAEQDEPDNGEAQDDSTEGARGAGDQPVMSPDATEPARDGPAETGAVEIDAAADPASVDPAEQDEPDDGEPRDDPAEAEVVDLDDDGSHSGSRIRLENGHYRFPPATNPYAAITAEQAAAILRIDPAEVFAWSVSLVEVVIVTRDGRKLRGARP